MTATTTTPAMGATIDQVVQPALKRASRSEVHLLLKNGDMPLYNLPVSVYTAVEEDEAGALNGLCYAGHDPVKIKQQFICPSCGSTGPHVKGQAKGAEGYVIIPKEVQAQAEAADAHAHDEITLTVHRTVDVNEAMPSGKTYYLDVPKKQPGARKMYAGLAKLIESRPDLTLVGTFAIRTTAYRYMLLSAGGTLMLRQMADPSMVRQRPVITDEVDAAQVTLLSQVLDLLVSDFDPLTRASKRSAVIAEYVATHEVSGPGSVEAQGAAAVEAHAAADISATLAGFIAAAGGTPTEPATEPATEVEVKAAPKRRAPRKRAAPKAEVQA